MICYVYWYSDCSIRVYQSSDCIGLRLSNVLNQYLLGGLWPLWPHVPTPLLGTCKKAFAGVRNNQTHHNKILNRMQKKIQTSGD